MIKNPKNGPELVNMFARLQLAAKAKKIALTANIETFTLTELLGQEELFSSTSLGEIELFLRAYYRGAQDDLDGKHPRKVPMGTELRDRELRDREGRDPRGRDKGPTEGSVIEELED